MSQTADESNNTYDLQEYNYNNDNNNNDIASKNNDNQNNNSGNSRRNRPDVMINLDGNGMKAMSLKELKSNDIINDENDLYSVPCKKRFYRFVRQHAYYFPLFVAILVPIVCLIPYTVAINLGHITPIFPYVSDTGTLAPQAGYFSMMLDLTAFFLIMKGIFRYKMIKWQLNNELDVNNNQDEKDVSHYHTINFVALWIICLSAFGLVGVGNFRVSELVVLHFIGAGLCFVPMFIYYALQVYMAKFLSKHSIESSPISMLAGTLMGGAGLLGFTFFSLFSIYEAGLGNFMNDDWRLHWNSNQPGYVWHCLGTLSEWIAINSMTLLSLCLYNRMKQFEHWEDI